jgi:hypothetical protein
MSILENKMQLLMAVDSTLISMMSSIPEILIEPTSTPAKWFAIRKSNGVKSSVLFRLLADYYDINFIHLNDCQFGTFIADGFYCAKTKIFYSTSVKDSHFDKSGSCGFLIKESDLKGVSNILSNEVLKLRKSFIRDEWQAQGVISTVIRKGFVYSDHVHKDIFLEKLGMEVDYWSTFSKEVDNYDARLISEIWGAPIQIAAKRIEAGSTQKLFILSGDYATESVNTFQQVIFESGKLYSSKIGDKDHSDILIITEKDLTDNMSISDHNEIQSIMDTGQKYVVFFSSARNIVDLLPQLKKLFSLKQIAMQFASHAIRVAMPKLCHHCQTQGKITSTSNMALEFSLEERAYMISGDGCGQCVDGYRGIHILKEDSFKDSKISQAILNAEANTDVRTAPFSILKEFKKSSVSTIYTSLGHAISHGLVQIKDSEGVLL